jgi:hypothetical protein
MGLFSAIFSGPQAVEHAFDTVSKGIDKAILTKEEASDWFLKWLNATKGSAIARRLLALMVTAVFLFQALLATGLAMLAKDRMKALLSVVDTFDLPQLVGIVFAFYFMHGMVRNMGGRK